ncbi:MAG: hypothetical protein AAFY08_16530, partial [Planctomycetota bacterium]
TSRSADRPCPVTGQDRVLTLMHNINTPGMLQLGASVPDASFLPTGPVSRATATATATAPPMLRRVCSTVVARAAPALRPLPGAAGAAGSRPAPSSSVGAVQVVAAAAVALPTAVWRPPAGLVPLRGLSTGAGPRLPALPPSCFRDAATAGDALGVLEVFAAVRGELEAEGAGSAGRAAAAAAVLGALPSVEEAAWLG